MQSAQCLRRRTLLRAATSAIAAFGIVRGRARAAQFEYKSAGFSTPDAPLTARLVQLWDAVARETNGRLVVTVFPSGQLGGQDAVLSQLRLGAIQLVATTNAAYGSIVPASAVDGLGCLFKDPNAPLRVMNGALG